MNKFDRTYLTKATDQDVKKIASLVEGNKAIRLNHAENRHGWTKDGSMRWIGRFDVKALFHPEWKKYFDPRMDKHEARKHIYKFLQIHPEFKVYD